MKKIAFLLFCWAQISFSQTAVQSNFITSLITDETLVELEGRIRQGKASINKFFVVELMYKDDVVASKQLAHGTNKFRFHLKPDCQYKVRISKEGYMSRQISVNACSRSAGGQK